jgi:periplasmic protein TonB
MMLALARSPEDRISAAPPGARGGARFGWAVCSLLFHGTALAAVLIAAAGDAPQLPAPAIEVSVVTVPAPAGAAASAAQTAPEAPEAAAVQEPAESEPDPVTELVSVDASEPRAAEPEPTRPEPRPEPVSVAEAAPLPEAALPPPPARKPAPPEPALAMQAPAASDAPPEPAPVAAAPPAQLAALPDAESVDSAAPPGAGVTQPPRYEAGGEANPWPRYPVAARRRGIEGEVLVRVAVGLDGRAERVQVVQSSGSALLDKAAIEAPERWRFEPARAAGQPVAATVEIPVTFRLTEPGGS